MTSFTHRKRTTAARAFFLAACALLGSPIAARAEPYKVVARYRDRDPKKPGLTIGVKQGVIIPGDTSEYLFDGIDFQTNTDDLSKAFLGDLRNFVLLEGPAGGKLKSRNLEVTPGTAQTVQLVARTDLRSDTPVNARELVIHGKFKSDYLCSIELRLRQAPVTSGSPPPDAKRVDSVKRHVVASAPGKPANEFAAYMLSQTGISGPGEVAEYSFCPSIRDAVDWKKLYKEEPEPRPSSEKALREREKKKVERAIINYLKGSGIQGLDLDEAEIESDTDPGAPTSNVLISIKVDYSVLKAPEQVFAFYESGTGKPISDLLDQGSSIVLNVKEAGGVTACNEVGGCGYLRTDNLTTSIFSQDNKGNPVEKKVDVDPLDGHLKVALSDYLDQTVQIGLRYTVRDASTGDSASLELFRTTPTTVRSLGLSATAPVFSELFTLAAQVQNDAVSLKDEKSQSSIPISWAFNANRKEGRHVAITFPGMISINPRSAPTLSKTLRFFAHGSLILPLDQDANTPGAKVAFGAGLYFFESIAFSWAVSTDGENYLMLGLNIPEAVKFFK